MFEFLKRRRTPDFEEIRRMLFGDVPHDEWQSRDGSARRASPGAASRPPAGRWRSETHAAAIDALRSVARADGQESRQILQAWHFLRPLDVEPDARERKRVLGVVL